MADDVEIAIIGAGPAGLAAAANAARHKLSHVLIEKREIGNTVYDYQLRKHVMAEPAKLPLRGYVPFAAGSREEVLRGWSESVDENGIQLRKGEVTGITKAGEVFSIAYGNNTCSARKVVLAIGVQGTPRKLGVPGQDLPFVSYTLADPDAFRGKDILVIGVGDAGIENALALCDANRVSILNTGDDFPRAKEANAAKLWSVIKGGKIRHISNSKLERLEEGRAIVSAPEGELQLKVDHLIARIGCIMPRVFLESCGVKFPNADPCAVPVVSRSYESNVRGLHILGALIGYPLIKQCMNQGHEVIEHILGNKVEPADQVLIEERLGHLPGSVNENLANIWAACPLFCDVSEAQFRELIIESTIHQAKFGEVIFKRNDYSDTFFSVVSGSVEIEMPSGKGIAVSAGGYFGEMGLLSGRRRSATVKCVESGILVETPRKQMLKLIASVDSVKRRIDEAFMQRALETAVFPEADSSSLREIVQHAKTKRFKKGEVLFREGDDGDVAYVIRKGSVKISRRDNHGADITQTYLAAGSLVGEMALLSAEAKPRSATVSAAVPCEVIAIEKGHFLELLRKSPATRARVEEQARSREIENITFQQEESFGMLLDFMVAQGVTDADNFLLIDSDLCVGCDNCEAACAATHGGYSRLDRKGGKTLASIQIPVSCRHCENPLCMLDCPPDALRRMSNGEVVIQDSCIGCGNCVRNCPYGVIQLVYENKEMPLNWLWSLFGGKSGDKGPAKAAKCDMCSELAGGPACVRSCPTGAALRVNPRRMLEVLAEKRPRS